MYQLRLLAHESQLKLVITLVDVQQVATDVVSK